MPHDLRQALRLLRLNPGFATLAILTLALGIGACVTMFTIVNGVLLRPLPYPHPERIVSLWEVSKTGREMRVAWPNFVDWREQRRTLDGVAAVAGGTTTVLGGREAMRADVHYVSQDFFRVLGVTPRLGRLFSDAEQRPGGTPVAIVSDEFWRDSLGGGDGADLAGGSKQITVDGFVAQVIGVMPPGFAYPSHASIWVPVDLLKGKGTRTAHNFGVIARLAEGQTIEAARADMDAIGTRLKARYGSEENAESIRVIDLRDTLVGPSRLPLQLLMGAVLLVLLIACANLANTLLASGTRRRREIAVRAALGASRGRLLRQLLTENVVLAIAGGMMGLACAAVLLPSLLSLAPVALPRLDDVRIDMRVALFASVLTLVTVALFGLLPALQTARADLREVLADAARGSSAPRTSRMRAMLITAQVGVAFVLLVGAGLLIRSLGAVMSQPIGIDPEGLLTVEIALPDTTYAQDAQVIAFYDRLVDAVRKLPGVESAAASDTLPLMGYANGTFTMTGSADQYGDAIYTVADTHYFQTMRIPLLAGRFFDARDTDTTHGASGAGAAAATATATGAATADHAAIISKSLADRYWPGRNAIGQRVRFLGMDKYAATWLTVVGVVGDVKARRMIAPGQPEIYVSEHQRPQRLSGDGYLVVRMTSGTPPERSIAAVTRTMRGIDPNVPGKFATYDTVVAENVADRRFTMQILTAFGVLALLLTGIGIYGVLAYTVAQRTPEIGIRMALGATRAEVVRLVLTNAFRSVAIGLTLGAAGAWLLTGTIRSFLFNVQPADPMVAAGALAALLAAATAAVAVPAWRASRVDPQVSMRAD